jgi:hypothetical protein
MEYVTFLRNTQVLQIYGIINDRETASFLKVSKIKFTQYGDVNGRVGALQTNVVQIKV